MNLNYSGINMIVTLTTQSGMPKTILLQAHINFTFYYVD